MPALQISIMGQRFHGDHRRRQSKHQDEKSNREEIDMKKREIIALGAIDLAGIALTATMTTAFLDNFGVIDPGNRLLWGALILFMIFACVAMSCKLVCNRRVDTDAG
jgi:hypothetical protein